MSQENVEIARAAYAAINLGDLEGFLALIDPDVEFLSLVAEVEGRVYRGHDGVREWWEGVANALGGLRFDVQEIHDLGDRGYAELVVTASVGGVDVPQRMWQAFVVRDGKPAWWATFRTEGEALEALESTGLTK